MKKNLLTLTIGFISITMLGSKTFAQTYERTVALNKIKNFKPSIRNLTALESLSYMGIYVPETKDINAKALKDFQVRYNNIKNAKWFSFQNGFLSYFIQDGFGNRVFYDKKGRWQYSLIFYNETKLPRDARSSVRSIYFDMNITLVEEVQTLTGKVYIVYVEDKSNIKILKVNDEGESEILLELPKE